MLTPTMRLVIFAISKFNQLSCLSYFFFFSLFASLSVFLRISWHAAATIVFVGFMKFNLFVCFFFGSFFRINLLMMQNARQNFFFK